MVNNSHGLLDYNTGSDKVGMALSLHACVKIQSLEVTGVLRWDVCCALYAIDISYSYHQEHCDDSNAHNVLN